jgi:archaellum biogenesis ATPase FlaH
MRWEDNKALPKKLADKVKQEPSGHFNASDDTFAVPLSDFLTNHVDTTEWVVEGILQRKSINMVMGAPKAGKSTLLRHLTYSLAYGSNFLGKYACTKSKILYYSLQENKPHQDKWWKTTLAAANLPLLGIPVDMVWRLGNRGEKAFKGLRQRLVEKEYDVVIIDMLGTFLGVDSLDDYTEVDRATTALNEISQDLNCCIIFTHHERKASSGMDSFAGAIGSQAIRGSVYTTIKSWKDHGRRYVATEQRDGFDLESTVVVLDKKTNDMRAGGSKIGIALADKLDRPKRVKELLEVNPALTAHEAQKVVGGRYQEIVALLEKIRRGTI